MQLYVLLTHFVPKQIHIFFRFQSSSRKIREFGRRAKLISYFDGLLLDDKLFVPFELRMGYFRVGIRTAPASRPSCLLLYNLFLRPNYFRFWLQDLFVISNDKGEKVKI